MAERVDFPPIIGRDHLSAERVTQVGRLLGASATALLGLGQVNIRVGTGRINATTRCMWTRAGRRITLTSTEGGGLIGSISKNVDPLYPDLERI